MSYGFEKNKLLIKICPDGDIPVRERKKNRLI